MPESVITDKPKPKNRVLGAFASVVGIAAGVYTGINLIIPMVAGALWSIGQERNSRGQRIQSIYPQSPCKPLMQFGYASDR